MAAPADEAAAEVAALDRLLTRLAFTDDSRLERVLAKLLPAALLRLASPSPASRAKVLEMLSHINGRVRHDGAIHLPLHHLLDIARDPDAAPMVATFAAVYLDLAFQRSSPAERRAVLGPLLDGVARRAPADRPVHLRLAAKALDMYGTATPLAREELQDALAFISHPDDRSVVLEFCLHSLIYAPPGAAERGQLFHCSTSMAPPGLSQEQAQGVAGTDELAGDALVTRKLGLLNFLSAADYTPADVYPHFLVASADGDERVSKRGEELVKHLGGAADLEDAGLVSRLFCLYLGTSSSGPAGTTVRKASFAVRARLLACFTHSVTAANRFPDVLSLIDDSVSGPHTGPRLKRVGMEFAIWVFKHVSIPPDFAPSVLPLPTTTWKARVLKFSGAWLSSSTPRSPTTPPLQAPHRFPGSPSHRRISLKARGDPMGWWAMLADAMSQQLRIFAFQGLGQLAGRAPHVFRENEIIVERFLAALAVEKGSTRSALQEASASLASAYKGCSQGVSERIERLLLNFVNTGDDAARFAAVQWASQLFHPTHALGRYICIRGAGDGRPDIREMAERALEVEADAGVLVEGKAARKLPQLRFMMDCIFEQQPGLKDPVTSHDSVLLFSVPIYLILLRFTRKCSEAEQGVKKYVREGGMDVETRQMYRQLLEHAFATSGTAELQIEAAEGILALASLDPQASALAGMLQRLALAYRDRLWWLSKHVASISSNVRMIMAKIMGIVTSALSSQEAQGLLQELHATLAPPLNSVRSLGGPVHHEKLHGSVCATGYVLAQAATGTPEVPREPQARIVAVLCSLLADADPQIAGAAAESLGHIGLRGPLPVPPGGLGPVTSSCRVDGDQAADEAEAGGSSLSSLVERMEALLQSADAKAVQKSVIALGHLGFGSPWPKLLDAAARAAFSLASSKAIQCPCARMSSEAEDVLFAAGESLAYIWGNLPISADVILRTSFTSLTTSFKPNPNGDPGEASTMDTDGEDEERGVRAKITEKLFKELLISERSEERCAGSVWLVSLLTYCGRQQQLQRILPEAQESLLQLLGDSNALTQDMASRGMSLVHELGDDATRKQLVAALVGTLSGANRKKRAVKLTEDTEVFQEGALGEAPGGGKLTTYKELCTLATEMGQPDLIYRFMDLENYQSSLNSSRGAAFGFAKIAKQAGAALEPHLATLLPKLLRYQYDPNRGIQDAMTHIWRALVVDPKATVDKHLDAILEDLLTSAGSRLWRSREASCLALSDLLASRRFDEVGNFLERLWLMAIRTMDDIKESVRVAGQRLATSVSNLSVRLCDPALTSPRADVDRAVAIVLPFLLSQGLGSAVADVQRLCLKAITKIVKGAGPAVRPHVPDLVATLLESLSSMEDQRLNYAEVGLATLHQGSSFLCLPAACMGSCVPRIDHSETILDRMRQMHTEALGLSHEKLEDVRVGMSRVSPAWDALDTCVFQVDDASLAALVPRLVSLARSAVGLNTRVGLGKVVGLLVQRLGPTAVRPYSGPLIRALQQATIGERSPTARRAFASACAEVANCAPGTLLTKLLQDAVALYSDPADKDSRAASGLLLRELSRKASSSLQAQLSDFLPLAYFARYDEEKEIQQQFSEVWEENSGTETAALQLYAAEIVALVLDALSSSLWTRKRQVSPWTQSALAIKGMAESGLSSLEGHYACSIVARLVDELPGRLWEGKESILEAVAAVSKTCHVALLTGCPSQHEPRTIVNVLVDSCKRRKKAFRLAALACLEKVLSAFHDVDMYEEVHSLLVPSCYQAEPSRASAGEDERDAADAALPAGPALACLSAAWSAASPSTVGAKGAEVTGGIAHTLDGNLTWNDRLVALGLARTFLKKLQPGPTSHGDADSVVRAVSLTLEERERNRRWVELLLPSILRCLEEPKYSQVGVEVLRGLGAGVGAEEALRQVREAVEGARAVEKSEEVAIKVAMVLAAVVESS
eukprot:SM000068S20624  [mRNA]  locus=s68:662290:671519:+ [translate_table: standard]